MSVSKEFIGRGVVGFFAVVGAVSGVVAIVVPDAAEQVRYLLRSGTDQPIEGLRRGDCVRVTTSPVSAPKFPDSRTPQQIYDVLSCEERHDLEVTAVLSLPTTPGADYPAVSDNENLWLEMCTRSYAEYVRDDLLTPPESSYDAPTAESWSADDRRIVCFASGDSGLVGSVAQ